LILIAAFLTTSIAIFSLSYVNDKHFFDAEFWANALKVLFYIDTFVGLNGGIFFKGLNCP
jgi:hypothetical protein